ncbi:MAG: ABC transporter permease [Candidatus Solibacter usitatus]|nr:ABC transporter permease [Candidatus Solibacter usitatus]
MKGSSSLWEAVNVAAGSLRASKLRSFLTLLGIILATTTLIAVMSVIEGMNQYIAKEVSDMGAEGFRIRRIIMLGEFDAKRYLELEKRNPHMNREEYDFVRERATLVREIGMEAFRSVKVDKGSVMLEQVQMSGVTPNMAAISSIKTVNGRYITESDEARRLSVAFIGNDIKEKFFLNVDPVGKTINVDGRPFEIIGVAKPLGNVFGQSRDKFVMIPAETYFKMYSSRRGLGYNALAIDQAHLEQAKDEVRSLLRAYRHLRPGQEDTFGIVASDSLVGMWDKLTGTIAATALGVVSVFMVVGGVVIMNIMLAAVTERTHEIGIRKSVGAKRSDILKQFLVEASMMAGAGGLAGVILAWIVAVLVRNFTPVPMQVPLSSIVVGVGLSSAVGLFFGIFPAQRAARLDPIEALRYEK